MSGLGIAFPSMGKVVVTLLICFVAIALNNNVAFIGNLTKPRA